MYKFYKLSFLFILITFSLFIGLKPITVLGAPTINELIDKNELKTLKVGQENTWIINVIDKSGYVSVKVNWGDGSKEEYKSANSTSVIFNPSLEFKHTFSKGGTYKVVFTAKDKAGSSTSQTLTSYVATPVPSFKISVSKPLSGNVWHFSSKQQITWKIDGPLPVFNNTDISLRKGNLSYGLGMAKSKLGVNSYTWFIPKQNIVPVFSGGNDYYLVITVRNKSTSKIILQTSSKKFTLSK
ncbi:MAG: hypothetical protein WCS86_03975 [Candidatus Paceibacterota bacterium]